MCGNSAKRGRHAISAPQILPQVRFATGSPKQGGKNIARR
jgi:hypothetical protein